jgi:hypothetical protein
MNPLFVWLYIPRLQCPFGSADSRAAIGWTDG